MQKVIQHYLLTAIFVASLLSLFLVLPVNAFADSSDVDNLSFIYVEKSHVDLGDTQRVALGLTKRRWMSRWPVLCEYGV